MTARLLVCAAVTVGVAVPVASLLVGDANTFVILAVAMLALGAGLMACDHSTVTRVRRIRIGAVTVSIVLLALIAVSPASPWRIVRQERLPVLKPASADLQPPAHVAG